MTTPLIDNLKQVQTSITVHYLPMIYIVGIVGNLFNLVVFVRRQLRFHYCSWYFICLSLSQLCLLNSACLTRIVISRSTSDRFERDAVLCKLRAYVTVLSLVLSRYFLCCIALDRWFITLGKHSFLIRVRWIISCSLIFWTLFSSHALIGHPSISTSYSLFSSLYSIITSAVPFFTMIIFSILTVLNIKHTVSSANQVVPYHSTLIRPKWKRDMIFIRLAVFQVIPYLLLNVLSCLSPSLLWIVRSDPNATPQTRAIVMFIHHLGIYLLYTYVSVSRWYVPGRPNRSLLCLDQLSVLSAGFAVLSKRIQASLSVLLAFRSALFLSIHKIV